MANWTQQTPNSAIWTTAQLAYALNIDSDIAATSDEQEFLMDLQASAVEYAETVMGCSLIQRTITAVQYGPNAPENFGYVYGSDHRHRMRLPRGPIISITSVTAASGEIASGNYQLEGEGCTDLLRVNIGYVAPLTVIYEAGYCGLDEYNQPIVSNIPADIRQAIRTHVATLHERRESATDRTITAVPHSLEAFYRSKARTVQVR